MVVIVVRKLAAMPVTVILAGSLSYVVFDMLSRVRRSMDLLAGLGMSMPVY